MNYAVLLRIGFPIIAVTIVYLLRVKNRKQLTEKTTRVKSLLKTIGLLAAVKVCAIALVMVILVLVYRG